MYHKIYTKSKKTVGKNERDFEAEILNSINRYPTGATIKDIANEIHACRTTVSKYIYRLHIKKKVTKKKFGAYYLHFIADRKFVSQDLVADYYKGLLYGLKQKFPGQEKIFKEIGYNVAKFWQLNLEYLPRFDKELDLIRNLTVKNFFEIFNEFFPYFDIYQKSLEIFTKEINYKENKAKYRFHHASLLEETDDFIYHFYVLCGIIEKTVSRVLNKTVICNVENIHISDKKGESYVDIFIEIS